MPKLYERQRDKVTGREEPYASFRWFIVYRDMGPGVRSLDAVTTVMRAELQESRGVAPLVPPVAPQASSIGPRKRRRATLSGQIEEYSRKWNWVMRAHAWDAEIDRVRLAGRLRSIAQMRERHLLQAQASGQVAMGLITANLRRQKDDPGMYDRLSPENSAKYGLMGINALSRAQADERLAHGPEPAAAENRQGELPISGALFGWCQSNCQCGHPHSEHNQQYRPDAEKDSPQYYTPETPCEHKRCKCRKFVESTEE
jgi:hypothetical protein